MCFLNLNNFGFPPYGPMLLGDAIFYRHMDTALASLMLPWLLTCYGTPPFPSPDLGPAPDKYLRDDPAE